MDTTTRTAQRTRIATVLCIVAAGLAAMGAAAPAIPGAAAAPATAEGVDLVVETVGGHTEFREGGAEGFGFAVTNYGTVNATNVVITVDLGGLSSRVKVDRIDGASCSRSGLRFTCRRASLGPLGEIHPAIIAEVTKGTPVGSAGSIAIRLSSDQDDVAPDNNAVSVSIEVLPPIYADLVASTDSPQAKIGDTVTVHARVTNRGPHDSGYWAVTISDHIDGLAFVSGPCQPVGNGNGNRDCPGRLLAKGQSQTIALRFRVTGRQNYYCGLGLLYQYPDPDPSGGLCGGDHGIVTYAGTGGSSGGGSGGSGQPVATAQPTKTGGSSPAPSASVEATPSAVLFAATDRSEPVRIVAYHSTAGSTTVAVTATAVTGLGLLTAAIWLLRRRRTRSS